MQSPARPSGAFRALAASAAASPLLSSPFRRRPRDTVEIVESVAYLDAPAAGTPNSSARRHLSLDLVVDDAEQKESSTPPVLSRSTEPSAERHDSLAVNADAHIAEGNERARGRAEPQTFDRATLEAEVSELRYLLDVTHEVWREAQVKATLASARLAQMQEDSKEAEMITPADLRHLHDTRIALVKALQATNVDLAACRVDLSAAQAEVLDLRKGRSEAKNDIKHFKARTKHLAQQLRALRAETRVTSDDEIAKDMGHQALFLLLGRLLRFKGALGFRRWCHAVREMRDNGRRQEARDSLLVNNMGQRALSMLLGRILRFKGALGFRRWRHVVREMREEECRQEAIAAIFRKTLGRLTNRAVMRGLRHWRDATIFMIIETDHAKLAALVTSSAALIASRNTADVANRIKRVLQIIGNSALRSGWHAWLRSCVEWLQARVKLVAARKTLGRIALAKQAAALNSWVVFSKYARDEEAALKKLLGRIMRLREATGWTAWRRAIESMREEERVANAQAAAVRRVFVNLLVSAKAHGLRQWRDAAKLVVIEKERVKLTALLLARSSVDTAKRMKRVIRIVFASTLRQGWLTWRRHELVFARARAKLVVAQKALGRVMSAKRAAALQAWVDVTKHARDEEAAVRRLLARLLRSKLSMGVDAWCRAVVKMRDEKKLDAARAAAVRKVLVTLLVKSEARGLRQWRNALRMQHWEHTLAAKQAELESHKKELESRKQDLEYHKQELDSHKQELEALAVKHASAATTHAAAHEERQSEVKAAKEKERRAREDLCRNSYGHHHEHAGRRGNGQAVVGTVADPRHSHH